MTQLPGFPGWEDDDPRDVKALEATGTGIEYVVLYSGDYDGDQFIRMETADLPDHLKVRA